MLTMINEILVKLTLTGFQLAYRGIWREDVNTFPKGREIEPFVYRYHLGFLWICNFLYF